MAHNLFDERFVTRRAPAWHNLGTVFHEAITASQAVEMADLDFAIGLYELVIPTPWGDIAQNKRAIVREPLKSDPQPRMFGIATDAYEVIQNREFWAMLNPLTEVFPVETAGALGKGETIFFVLDAGEATVGGEQIKNYFLLTDTRTGNEALKLVYTPVRVVCQNTLTAGLEAAIVTASLSHEQNLRADLDARLKVMASMKSSQERILAMMNQMTIGRLSEEQVTDILLAAYPEPTMPRKVRLMAEIVETDPSLIPVLNLGKSGHFTDAQQRFEWVRERIRAFRLGARERFVAFNDEQPTLAYTPWALFNSVVEVEDYRKGTSNPNASNPAYSALFGDRAKTKARAFDACYTAKVEAVPVPVARTRKAKVPAAV